IDCEQTVLHYGWIPFIIYVGYTRSNPQPSLIKCVYSSFVLLPNNVTFAFLFFCLCVFSHVMAVY
ncbi:uncharacterized protein STEHIDRAFT_54966, partial [Stereum hirsutum FP-91666 SS1]|uniref:uncharacterized protein n=1 Tax=Stereum hirsutum (strain FP-91666) TaxID=721885 RepID=UPI000440BE6B